MAVSRFNKEEGVKIVCSPTFLNLSEEKKERIINAALEEFSLQSFSDASITNIVKKAEISRGSFYQYFGNKENLYNYLVHHLYTIHRSDLLNILIQNSGNLYDSLMSFFNSYIDELVQSNYFSFYKNTFLYVNHHLVGKDGIFSLSNQSSSREKQQQQFIDVIDMSDVKTDSGKEILEYIYFMVTTIHHMIIDGFVNDLSVKEIKGKSSRAVDWLYYGINQD